MVKKGWKKYFTGEKDAKKLGLSTRRDLLYDARERVRRNLGEICLILENMHKIVSDPQSQFGKIFDDDAFQAMLTISKASKEYFIKNDEKGIQTKGKRSAEYQSYIRAGIEPEINIRRLNDQEYREKMNQKVAILEKERGEKYYYGPDLEPPPVGIVCSCGYVYSIDIRKNENPMIPIKCPSCGEYYVSKLKFWYGSSTRLELQSPDPATF